MGTFNQHQRTTNNMPLNLNQLNKVIQDYQEVILCRSQLKTVEEELHIQTALVKQLKVTVEKEHQDVLRLESLSLKQLFSTLLINKQAQLEKERQEYLLAALKLNECLNLIELLEYEKKILKQKLKSEKKVIATLELSLDEYQLDKRSPTPKELILLKSINQELKDIIRLKTEAQEALAVIKELQGSLKDIIKALEAANLYDEWGLFYKEKQIAKVKKKQYIDQAQAMVYIVRKQLIFLRSELIDVKEFEGLFKEAKDLFENFNLEYYNDLITDWINVLKLHETIEHTLGTYKTISKLGTLLRKLVKQSNQEYQILFIKRSTLIQQVSQ